MANDWHMRTTVDFNLPLPAALRRWGVNDGKKATPQKPAPRALVAWERKPVLNTGFANPSRKATGARVLYFS